MPPEATARGERRPGEDVRIARYPSKGSLGELARVAFRALGFWPPLWVQSILGPVRRWKPRDELSEFTILDPRRLPRAVEYLSRILIPAARGEPPAAAAKVLPRVLRELFWRSTTVFAHPGLAGRDFPRERWFFVNGIVTNEALARINATLLTALFHRPVQVIQNATHSLPLDVHETAIGKEFKTDPDHEDRGTFTEAGLRATIAVLDALNEPEVDRVVLIAHSQGTVIAANVLRAITKALRVCRAVERPTGWMRAGRAAVELTAGRPARLRGLRRELARCLTAFLGAPELGLGALRKLEIYTFANCADKMKYVVEREGRGLPVLEHFANERDWVARLGILSPLRDDASVIDIDGPLFIRRATRWPGEGWGHFLNDAYLFAIRDHLESRERGGTVNPYRSPADGEAVPRLYGYFDGDRPD